jgi:hypothetical protein
MPKHSKRSNKRQSRSRDPVRSARLPGGAGGRQQQAVGFPDRITARLQYTTSVRVSPGVVTYQDTVYRLNSPFDPEFSGAGHQPRGWDTLAGLYDRYRVKRCRAVLHARQRAAHGIQVVLIPSNQSASLINTDYPSEIQRATPSMVTGSSQPTVNLDVTYVNHDILGQTAAQYNANEDTASLTTTNPTEAMFLHVFAFQLDGATVLDYEHVISLFYDVEFFDRRYEGPSSIAEQIAELRQLVASHERQDEEVAGDDQPVVVRRAAPPSSSTLAPRRPAGRPG